MFIGGVFVFGGNQTRAGAWINLIIGLVNLGIGVVMVLFGFSNASLILKVIGFVFGGLGLLMVLFSIMGLRKLRDSQDSDTFT